MGGRDSREYGDWNTRHTSRHFGSPPFTVLRPEHHHYSLFLLIKQVMFFTLRYMEIRIVSIGFPRVVVFRPEGDTVVDLTLFGSRSPIGRIESVARHIDQVHIAFGSRSHIGRSQGQCILHILMVLHLKLRRQLFASLGNLLSIS